MAYVLGCIEKIIQCIKVTKIENVKYLAHDQIYDGSLQITVHHINFFLGDVCGQPIVKIFHPAIEELISLVTTGTLKIITKNVQSFTFNVGETSFNELISTLKHLTINSSDIMLHFIYINSLTREKTGDSNITESTLESQNNSKMINYTNSRINKKFELCKYYSETVNLPDGLSDDLIQNFYYHFNDCCFPVLSYVHEGMESMLIRSSFQSATTIKSIEIISDSLRTYHGCPVEIQKLVPKVGSLISLSSISDQITNNSSNDAVIIGNNIMIPSQTELLENIGLLFRYIINPEDDYNVDFFSNKGLSSIMNYVQSFLKSSINIVKSLVEDKVCIWLQEQNGREFIPLICSLVKIIIDPFYRTIEGFIQLIKYEWVYCGFDFKHRNKKIGIYFNNYGNNGNNSVPKQKTEHCPIFFLFIMSLYQIFIQFSCHFEFDYYFLKEILVNSYYSSTYDFICESPYEMSKMVEIEESSLWKRVNKYNNRFINPLYIAVNTVLKIRYDAQILEIWHELLLPNKFNRYFYFKRRINGLLESNYEIVKQINDKVNLIQKI